MSSLLKTVIFCLLPFLSVAQVHTLTGKVLSNADSQPLPYVSVRVMETNLQTLTNEEGVFEFSDLRGSDYRLKLSSLGYKTMVYSLIEEELERGTLTIRLEEDALFLNEVVITGTRTAKKRLDSPVIVDLIDHEELEQLVAINLAESLNTRPGLRVETDCQTCNYTQLRMNGLPGGYSQVLVNGRPIFSPLTGLYGLEQVPVNMIERIEVVRGGASALYGSSAIGGTVNVITRMPERNSYSLEQLIHSIDGASLDRITSGNLSLVDKNNRLGLSLSITNREREFYDANGDNFSELSKLENTSVGMNLIYRPAKNHKLEMSLSRLYEYRFGGEMVNLPASLTQQSEERTHRVFMGSLDYRIDINEGKSSMIFFYGAQRTNRDHYTGIAPDEGIELDNFIANPPYGNSTVSTHQGGIQFNHRMDRLFLGNAVWSVGVEYLHDDVVDQIKAYNYLIDQSTADLGFYAQNDWSLSHRLKLLAGFRIDSHSLVADPIFSPRVSMMYKIGQTAQMRLGWGTGFRAPQAFDTDLHLAFAGGGVSRISLAEDLKEERSSSITASFNYDMPMEKMIAGFTLEGFYTVLNDAFYQSPLGEDEFGERFEKRNGPGARVQGMTLEARMNYHYVLEFDMGFTWQTSLFEQAVENVEGLPALRQFLRTPNEYGYARLSYHPAKDFEISSNVNYTGPMTMVHFGGEGTGQLNDEYFRSGSFLDLDLRLAYTFKLDKLKSDLEIFGGVKNVLDAYQSDFDRGKNRDSNFIYGPALPRTYFLGLRLQSF